METIEICINRHSVNFLTAMMPTMGGLFLATVKDGKTGQVVLSFSSGMKRDVLNMLSSLGRQFPEEPGWRIDGRMS